MRIFFFDGSLMVGVIIYIHVCIYMCVCVCVCACLYSIDQISAIFHSRISFTSTDRTCAPRCDETLLEANENRIDNELMSMIEMGVSPGSLFSLFQSIHVSIDRSTSFPLYVVSVCNGFEKFGLQIISLLSYPLHLSFFPIL